MEIETARIKLKIAINLLATAKRAEYNITTTNVFDDILLFFVVLLLLCL